jgi:hypothetical protein
LNPSVFSLISRDQFREHWEKQALFAANVLLEAIAEVEKELA